MRTLRWAGFCAALGGSTATWACSGAALENTSAPGNGAPLTETADNSSQSGDQHPLGTEESQSASALADLACVQVRAEARYSGIGYNHIAALNNTCGHGVKCEVRTDVSPTPVQVSLEPGQATEVLTFRGSPAATFRATVSCDKS